MSDEEPQLNQEASAFADQLTIPKDRIVIVIVGKPVDGTKWDFGLNAKNVGGGVEVLQNILRGIAENLGFKIVRLDRH